MAMAASGCEDSANMRVRDIYGGGDYANRTIGINLDGNLTASFFGKLRKEENIPPSKDLCRALLTMIAQNVTQIAYLNARLHNVSTVVFTGNFLRHNPIALHTLSYNMHRWSALQVLNICVTRVKYSLIYPF